jgi:hypothetical protein
MSLTKRRQVNSALEDNLDAFIDTAKEVIRVTRIINSVNYDLRSITTKQSVEWLKATIESTHIVKKNWISLRRNVDDVISSLDWYINRCNIDLKKYREKLHGETHIIPGDEFSLPEWED